MGELVKVILDIAMIYFAMIYFQPTNAIAFSVFLVVFAAIQYTEGAIEYRRRLRKKKLER